MTARGDRRAPRRSRVTADALAFDPEIVRRLARSTEENLFADREPEERRTILRLVRKAWENELTECQRRYLLCYYQDTMTMREIAETFGVGIPTVSRTLKRARCRLRHILQYYLESA